MIRKTSFLVIALLLINLSLIYATPTIKSVPVDELNYLESYEENRNPQIGIEDHVGIKSISGDDYWIVASKSNPTLQRERFVKYLTSSWAKADNYNYSSTVGYSWSLSGNYEPAMFSALSFSFTTSLSKSHSIGTNIPADQNRYSRLGFAADYNRYYATMKYKDYWTTQTLKTVYGVVIQEPTEDTYLLVVYN